MFSIIATVAVLASSAVAQSVGSATVINQCNYDVYMANTPAQFGGFSEVDETLKTGDSYTQTWTELTNGNGWSLKLSKSNTDWSNIMQYEYTFHNDGIIWYDISDVNGNPWNSDWEITANSSSSTCTPKQQAYRYATDDAYGMQSCPQDSDITVTLCSGESQNDGAAASASVSVAAFSSSKATAQSVSTFSTPSSTPTIVAAAVSTPAAASSPSTSAPASVQSTTFATVVYSTSPVTNGAGATVTQLATAMETVVVTQTHWKHHQYTKRHFHE
ncbi:hypothetical protein LTR62_004521 [Meristemomyces frigidus]|uniref:Uncharacterized protein n=1 Tax=Meristemomyces frigidus TaxID=1508187 RepID=A0AAN7TEJ5_9PEZI|nr:hypothetical protein LTR62_004521 [Meristemomyces frigidus]